MKTFVCLLLVALVGSAVAYDNFLSEDEIVAKVNSANAGWTAAKSERFAGMHIHEIQAMMGTVVEEAPKIVGMMERNTNVTDIPSEFDARQKWGKCIHEVENQEKCGSCWAFSATEALSDRLCISGTGSDSLILSPQELVSCDSMDGGCNGGRLNTAWRYMTESGVPDRECEPYTSGEGQSGSCPSTCKDGSAKKRYFAKSYYSVVSFFDSDARRVEKMQKELLANGPIQVAFTVYQDFMSYKSGVYKHTSGSMLGGHAVKLVGWGTEDGTPYWLIQNSWGPTWGLEGFFKIVRGQNACGIESSVEAGLPSSKVTLA